MTKRTRLIAAGIGTVALVCLAIALWLQGPERHADLEGPLGSEGGYEAMKIDAVASRATSWTYGLRLCIYSGDEPAILESVSPTKSVGSGYRLLGVRLRAFTPTQDHSPIIGVDGWPPPVSEVPDPLEGVSGFAVSTRCEDGPYDPYTELLVGFGLVSTDGGGWQGIDVAYRIGGRHRVVFLNHDLMICGTSVDCSIPGSSQQPKPSDAVSN